MPGGTSASREKRHCLARFWPSRFADLPERVLACEPAVLSKGPKVAAPDFDPLALDRRPAYRPLRNATAAASEVVVVAVLDIRDAFEAGRQPPTHFILAYETPPPRIGPARGFEDTAVSEVGHDRVEVVSVERV